MGTTEAEAPEAHQQEANTAAKWERVEATETPDYPESPQPPRSTAQLEQQARPLGLPRPNFLQKIHQAARCSLFSILQQEIFESSATTPLHLSRLLVEMIL